MIGKLTGQQVVDQLREAIARRATIVRALPGVTWASVYVGDVPYFVGGWRIIFYNDCDELDYCQYAEAPDGSSGDLQLWLSTGDEPISLLTETDRNTLQVLLSNTRRVLMQKSAEDLAIEARGREYAKAGYPLEVDEQALGADEILKTAEKKKREGVSNSDKGK
jgi:hypothetical protein